MLRQRAKRCYVASNGISDISRTALARDHILGLLLSADVRHLESSRSFRIWESPSCTCLSRYLRKGDSPEMIAFKQEGSGPARLFQPAHCA